MIDFDLDFSYEEETLKALSNMKGTIKKGQCIVLCGSSGCGKSTMVRTINRLIPDFYEGNLQGFCLVNGHDVEKLSIGETGELVTSVFQDPRSQFFTMDSCTEIAFGLENLGIPQEEIHRRVENAFTHFKMEKLKNRNVFELSAGERQLIAILCMWAADTEICLLDEPTANLDFAAIEQLKNALVTLKAQGKTIVINEHRLYYLKDIADEYWLMENGSIKNKFTAQKMNALSLSQINEIGLRTNSLEKLHYIAEKEVDLEVQLENRKEFIAKDICFGYGKSKSNLLNKFSLQAKTGDVVAIIGSNGCGKTTFGKIATGLLPPSSGSVFFGGKLLSKKERIANSMFIMQEAEFQFFTNSVYNELTYGRELTAELAQEIEVQLKKFDMWQLRNRHPFSISGGQMQKLTILLAYFSAKPIVVLDEPTAGLDYMSLKSCIDLLQMMRKTKLVFVITHDLEFISKGCSKCVCVSHGKNQQEFNLEDEGVFSNLTDYMQTHIKLRVDELPTPTKKKSPTLDPRAKLVIVISTVLLSTDAEMTLLITIFLGVFAMMIYERRYKVLLLTTIIFGLAIGLGYIFPSPVFIFIANFFPRFVLLAMAILSAAFDDGVAGILAALRKLHISEKIIMICSVAFRFFPVLKNDLKIMSQSIKTRGFFTSTMQKFKHLFEYIEIVLVPLSFRVIRIAEALSASAETRGINLKRKRSSYIVLKFELVDYFMLILFVCLITLGILI